MKSWGNSKALTKSSYELVKANPGMNRWTVRAAVHGAVIGGIGSVIGLGIVGAGELLSDPKAETASAASTSSSTTGTILLVIGAIVVIISVIAGLTAANRQLAGLVHATDDVLHGRPVDEQAAKDAAHEQIGTIAAWSAISVAVGALVSFIRGDGDNGVIVAILRSLLAGLVAAVWAVVTTLVLPVIVLEKVGAVAAIKRSASLIRSTWGEAVFGSVRIGARFALIFVLPGILLVIVGVALGVVGGVPGIVAGAVLAVVGVVLVVIGSVKAATCRTVFGVALYRWTTGEGALGPFTEDDLRGAVRTRSTKAAATV